MKHIFISPKRHITQSIVSHECWQLFFLFFPPLFNQLWRSPHNTENEVISTSMPKLITSSWRLCQGNLLQALWPVHRNIFSHLAFQPLMKAMLFKISRAPSQQEFVVNPFPLWKACDGSESPGLPSSHTALSLGDNHNPSAETPESRCFSSFIDTHAYSSDFHGPQPGRRLS